VVGLLSKVGPRKKVRPYLKNNLKQKMAGGMDQVVEYLPSNCEAMSSNPSTSKEQKDTIRKAQ
jgi:hypothetical protein